MNVVSQLMILATASVIRIEVKKQLYNQLKSIFEAYNLIQYQIYSQLYT